MFDAAVVRLSSALLVTGSAIFLGSSSVVRVPKNVVVVTARDFALEVPATVRPGVVFIQLLNKGKQQHHMSIVRLDGGHTAAEGLKAIMAAGLGPRPAWLHPVGGPQAAMPGGESSAVLTLDPGSYLAFCEVPGPEAVPHFMKGMAKAFTVSGPVAGGKLPTADVQLSLNEYDFTFAKPLTRGRHNVAVTNTGTQPHMVVITRLPPGQDFKPWLDWANDPKGRQAPGRAMGGIAEIAPGGTVVFPENFTPGHYGLICFTADAKDGKPHFLHGMQKEIDVR
jgi:hypothetical protein